MADRALDLPVAEANVNAFGIQVRVSISGDNADDTLRQLVAPWNDTEECFSPDKQSPYLDLGKVDETTFERVHSNLSTAVTMASLKYHRGSLLMLHAGGVARTNGDVLLIAGPSGSGKTTTVCNLARELAYVSDETIAIRDDGSVISYRKPLSVITKGHRYKLQVSPSELGLKSLPQTPLRLGSVVLLSRGENSEIESRVEQMPMGQAIIQLVQQTSYLADLSDPLCRIARMGEIVGGFKRLVAGAPSSIIRIEDELFQRGPKPVWNKVMPSCDTDSQVREIAFVPGDVLDAIECEDGTVVMTRNRQAHLLSGISPSIWRLACEGAGWQEARDRIVEEFGAPPSGDVIKAIADVCDELVSLGVLASSCFEPDK